MNFSRYTLIRVLLSGVFIGFTSSVLAQDMVMSGKRYIAQDVDAKSGYVDVGAKLDFFLGHGLHLSLNGGGAYNARSLNTTLKSIGDVQDSKDNLKILNLVL